MHLTINCGGTYLEAEALLLTQALAKCQFPKGSTQPPKRYRCSKLQYPELLSAGDSNNVQLLDNLGKNFYYTTYYIIVLYCGSSRQVKDLTTLEFRDSHGRSSQKFYSQ